MSYISALQVVGAGSYLLRGCLSVTFHIVDLGKYYVCCISSGVSNPMHYFMVHYLCCMCQCGLHAVLWSHIGIPMRHLGAGPCRLERFLIACQDLCETILMTHYSMVSDLLVSRAGRMLFLIPFVFYCFPFLFFHSLGWYCGAAVFGLIGRLALSPCFGYSTFFNINNNYQNVIRHVADAMSVWSWRKIIQIGAEFLCR